MAKGPTPEQLLIQERNRKTQEQAEKARKDLARKRFVCNGQLVITDPCYSSGTWCALWNLKARPGEWTAKVRITDEVPGRLEVRHPDFKDVGFLPWEFIGKAGVDSGQLGVFAAHRYPTTEETGEFNDLNTFYGRCCAMTLTGPQWGILEEGAVSRSGNGDGVYNVYGAHDYHGILVGVKVVFLGREPR